MKKQKPNRIIYYNILFLLLLLSISNTFAEIISNVPFVLQKTHFCGPAALSSVMGYYDLKISQDEIAKHVYTEKLQGALVTDLENFAKKTNFKTKLSIGSTNEIKNYIKQKKPVIVLIDVGFWVMTYPHYLVIMGYNEKGFIAHTGLQKSKLFLYKEFLDMWHKMGNTYLVIYKEK